MLDMLQRVVNYLPRHLPRDSPEPTLVERAAPTHSTEADWLHRPSSAAVPLRWILPLALAGNDDHRRVVAI